MEVKRLVNYQEPVNSPEFEQAVLGAALLEKRGCMALVDFLQGRDEAVKIFYQIKHQTIARVIMELDKNKEPVDILTVKDKLAQIGRLDETDGVYYLTELTSKVASAANIDYHLKALSQKYILREMGRIGLMMTAASVQEVDAFEWRDKFSDQIEGLADPFMRVKSGRIGEMIDDHVAKILIQADKINSGLVKSIGVSTGNALLDYMTGGFCKTNFWLLGARPGMGKTAFVLSCALYSALAGIPVLIISLEMSRRDTINRLISMMCGIDNYLLARARVSGSDLKKLEETAAMFYELPLYITDGAGMNFMDTRTDIRYHVHKHGVQVSHIDYAQMLAAMPGAKYDPNGTQKLNEAGRGYRTLANELDTCINLMSQFNRELEKRDVKMPQEGDFAGSDAMYQAATHSGGLYRPGHYDKKIPNYCLQKHPEVPIQISRRSLLINLFKQTNGPVGLVPMEFIPRQTKVVMPKEISFFDAWNQGIEKQDEDQREEFEKMLVDAGVNMGHTYQTELVTGDDPDRDMPF